jgi:hypothetical protein
MLRINERGQCIYSRGQAQAHSCGSLDKKSNRPIACRAAAGEPCETSSFEFPDIEFKTSFCTATLTLEDECGYNRGHREKHYRSSVITVPQRWVGVSGELAFR